MQHQAFGGRKRVARFLKLSKKISRDAQYLNLTNQAPFSENKTAKNGSGD